jgi:cytochrome c-type biogenesis protein CcmE
MKTKQKRKLGLIASLTLIGAALGYLVWGNFQDSLVYFYTPTELIEQAAALEGKKIRLAGLVEPGSLQRSGRLDLAFNISDGSNSIAVAFTGITPDLFAEGQMAIAEGRLGGEKFAADQIMAKHSEDYDPDQMKYPHVNELKPEKW